MCVHGVHVRVMCTQMGIQEHVGDECTSKSVSATG